MRLTDDSDAKAAVIDAGCAEMGTGPLYPPPPAEAELLLGLLLMVVKPDAVLVFGAPFPLDALGAFDHELTLAVPTAEPEPVEPAPPVPMPVPGPVEPLPVAPLPVESLLIVPVAALPGPPELLPIEPDPVEPPVFKLLETDLVPVKPVPVPVEPVRVLPPLFSGTANTASWTVFGRSESHRHTLRACSPSFKYWRPRDGEQCGSIVIWDSPRSANL